MSGRISRRVETGRRLGGHAQARLGGVESQEGLKRVRQVRREDPGARLVVESQEGLKLVYSASSAAAPSSRGRISRRVETTFRQLPSYTIKACRISRRVETCPMKRHLITVSNEVESQEGLKLSLHEGA